MKGGWIKLHRDLVRWQWYDDSLMVHLYIHLLLSANYEERQWRGITIRRGQLVTSTQKLAEAIHSTYKMVFTRLCKLEECGEISKYANSKFSIITITKYDDYVLREPAEGSAMGQQRDSNGTQYKNIIRNKELIKKDSPLTPQGGKEDPSDKNNFTLHAPTEGLPQAPFPPVAPTPLSPAFEKWLAYKEEKRQSYRSEASLRACYKRLERYSKGDPKVAMEIIDQSIAMNYSGFFEPKQTKTNHENRPECITNAAEAEEGTRYSTI